jgi:hypothetical protein
MKTTQVQCHQSKETTSINQSADQPEVQVRASAQLHNNQGNAPMQGAWYNAN